MKIVIPTDDKKTIAKFTGRAAYFQVFEVQDQGIDLIKTIENHHHHEHGHAHHHEHEHHAHHGHHAHHEQHSRDGHSHTREVAAMKDADLMICSHMGKHFEQTLHTFNIGIYVTKIKDIYEAIEEYRTRKV